MISESFPTRKEAEDRTVQLGSDRFSTICPNAEIEGEYLVIYEVARS